MKNESALFLFMPPTGVEPVTLSPERDFKSLVSASSTTATQYATFAGAKRQFL